MKVLNKILWFIGLASLIVIAFVSSSWELMSISYISAFKSSRHNVTSQEVIANSPSLPVVSWPHIMNLSLTVAGDVYVDGWAIKGNSIVMSALFPESTGPLVIRLRDARSLYLPCSLQRFSGNLNVAYVPAYIVCRFLSASDMNERMDCGQLAPRYTPPCMRCCSNTSAQTVAISINTSEIYVSRLVPFPKADPAIVLPVLHNDLFATTQSEIQE